MTLNRFNFFINKYFKIHLIDPQFSRQEDLEHIKKI